MWTPKRVLLLLLGMVFFTTAYGVYAYFLGAVDGLPELPAEYADRNPNPINLSPVEPPEVDRKLRLAFGEECPELHRAIKLDIRARGMVLAADQFTIVQGGPRDGQVELKPFSVATFGKSSGPGEFPEINTVRSDVAYLTFDQPITSAAEMGNHKVIGGELVSQISDDGPAPVRLGSGGVSIVNNRRTPERDDDLTLFTPGPVFYQEAIHKIWTQEAILLVDEQSKPKPTRVNAIGMDVYLLMEDEEPAEKATGPKKADRTARAEKPAKPGKARGKTEAAKKGDKPGNISGVKGILLRSNVDMYLFVESNSSFMSGPTKTPSKTRNDKSSTAKTGKEAEPLPPKDPVHIHTQGPFYYDSLAETARFDISQHPGPTPNHVEVIRTHETTGGGSDQLDCDHLELQMVRKSEVAGQGTAASTAPPNNDATGDLEIEAAHAWGEQVILTSDAENLNAFGQDLVHNTKTRESTLKGSPGCDMTAMKDGNEITARQLVLMGTAPGDKDKPTDKETQQARAIGPGIVKMLNKQTGKRDQQARFKDELLVSKDGKYDVLTLIGDASFEDLEHAQRLSGERLKVWLEPGDQPPPDKKAAPPPEKKGAAEDSTAQHRRPHHLEAIGHVSAWSPGEMNIHDTDRLVVFFEDAPPPTATAAAPADAPAATPLSPAAAPANVVTQKPTPAAPSSPAAAPAGPTAAAPATPAPAAAATPAKGQTTTDKPKQPIDLRARYVEAHVRRTGEKNDLERLWCEGDVRAKQEPSEPGEEGNDIRGETMQLFVFPEGNVLTVTNQTDLAEVKLGKLNIIGPEVNIDQKENKAWVNGIGSMRMPSDTSLTSGEKLAQPTELTVYWNRDMFFNGKYALFHGGVQAEQNTGRLACQTMQVFLDRFVSLRQNPNPGEKKDGSTPPAKVQKLVCDKSVRVDDRKIDEKSGKLIGYQRLINPELSLDNEENIVVGPGPGEVRLLQLGDKDEGTQGPGAPPPPPTAANGAPPEQEMKLTQVTYLGRMFANNNTRIAIFYDTVQVIHVPSDDINQPLSPDHLPESGLYLRCDLLKVFSHRDPNGQGQAHQEMEAHGRALVQSAAFWGRADLIKYDESKELLIFESGEGHLSTLYKIEVRGQQPKELTGKRIYYWKKTGAFRIEGGYGFDVPQYDATSKKQPATGPAGTTPSSVPGKQ